METLGLSSEDLAQCIGIEASGVRRRLSGETPWVLWEAYKVLDLLEEGPESIYLYFPAQGEDVEEKDRKRIRAYLTETNQSLVSDSTLDALIALVEGISAARMPGTEV